MSRGRRGLLALAALLALAWLAVLERDAMLQQDALGLLRKQKLAQAESNLRRARYLNPDSAPDIARAVLQLGGEGRHTAAATLNDVLRREPQNLQAWFDLLLTSGSDATYNRVHAAVQRLDPIDARGG
ncbi:MAG: hypothetical protein NVSMB51_20820 [Solirubrobacteraceae bacterium]